MVVLGRVEMEWSRGKGQLRRGREKQCSEMRKRKKLTQLTSMVQRTLSIKRRIDQLRQQRRQQRNKS
jgi:hypothetical protein